MLKSMLILERFIKISILVVTGAAAVLAQGGASDVGIRPNLAGGDVVSVEGTKIVIKTKDGEIAALISDKTEFKRVPPENPSLKAAVAADISAIGEGDKVLVTGMVAEDRKTIPAKTLYLITKSSISDRNKKESEEWRTRGVAGKIVTYNPQTNAITVSVRTLMGDRNITVIPKEKAEYLRYSQDSVRFSDAKKSSFSEIEPGDNIRALGDKNADGSEVRAEKIVTGAFRTVVGNVTAVNSETGEVVIADIQTKKPVTITIPATATLQNFPPEMAQRFAMFPGGGAGAGTSGAGGGFRPPQGGQGGVAPQSAPQGQAPQGGGMRMAGGPAIDDILERLPKINVADLKVGDMIAVSSTKTVDPSKIRAIKLVSGVEPLIRAQQQSASRGGSRGADSGFTIPGLDGGFGIP